MVHGNENQNKETSFTSFIDILFFISIQNVLKEAYDESLMYLAKIEGKGDFRKEKIALEIRDRDFPGGAVVKNPPANAGTPVRARVWEDPTCREATKPVRHNY